jgi:ubiquitin carboxyl-terminal hydrolase 34
LNNLFDKVEKYVKESEQLQQLEKIFQGKTICEITCKECQTKKEKVEDYYHLALEVKNMASLKESFAKFISPEEIEDYFCETCEKKAKSITKQTFIQSAPEILIINLQRIIFDLNTFQKVKVHSKLEFPDTLELHEFMHNTKEGPKIGNQDEMMTNEQ